MNHYFLRLTPERLEYYSRNTSRPNKRKREQDEIVETIIADAKRIKLEPEECIYSVLPVNILKRKRESKDVVSSPSKRIKREHPALQRTESHYDISWFRFNI